MRDRLGGQIQFLEAFGHSPMCIGVGGDAKVDGGLGLADDGAVVFRDAELSLVLRHFERFAEQHAGGAFDFSVEPAVLEEQVDLGDGGVGAVGLHELPRRIEHGGGGWPGLGIGKAVGGIAEERQREHEQRQLPDLGKARFMRRA